MANKVQGYGFSREVADKLDKKYKADDEKEIVEWLKALGLGTPSATGKDAFQEFLMDGQVLCNLANRLVPGSIKKIHDPSTIRIAGMRSMKCQENISYFLKFCTNTYKMRELDLFQTVALYEGSNLSQVQITLFKLGSMAKTQGFSGPTIGVQVAEENKRNFTEQQMKAGQFIPAKTSGNNLGASQSGSTPYGLGRQIIDNTAAGYKADTATLGLRSGTNAAQHLVDHNYGARREISDETSKQYAADYSGASAQMGNNQGASQSGMTAPGTGRQIM